MNITPFCIAIFWKKEKETIVFHSQLICCMLIDFNCAFSINVSIKRKRLDPEWLEGEF